MNRKRIIPPFICFVLMITGCGEREERITYGKNEKILTYDELRLWAADMAADMAGQEFESSKRTEEGLVVRDYGYVRITYREGIIPEIMRLEMIRPNLACPRGVFLGNPLEKIESYYHAAQDEYGQGLEYFYEEKKDGVEKYAYGMREDDKIELGAASGNADGTFTCLKLEYFLVDDMVSSIVYTADPEKDASETEDCLEQVKDRVNQDLEHTL